MTIAKQVMVVGLGGIGVELLDNLEGVCPEHVQFVRLDVDTEVFGHFFYGYNREVFSTLQQQLRLLNYHSVASWFDFNRFFSPLSDLPDIFLSSTTRSAMRASLLFFREKLEEYFLKKFDFPDKIILVSSTFGSTGSAWILELASLLHRMFPAAVVELVLNSDKSSFWPNSFDSMTSLANEMWCVREILADDFIGNRAYLVESTELAIERVKAIVETPLNKSILSERDNLEKWLLLNLQDLYIVLGEAHPNILSTFEKTRCYPISHFLRQDVRNSLAGLMMAKAEDRIMRQREVSSSCVRKLSFVSRDSSTFMLNVLSYPHPGQDFIGLALSHSGFGSVEQSDAIDELSGVGSEALSGINFHLAQSAREGLLEIRRGLKSHLDHTMEYPFRKDTAICNDLFPALMNLIGEILDNDGKEYVTK